MHSSKRFSQPFMQRLKVWFALFVTAVLLVVILPVNAQVKPLGNEVDGFPVMLDGKEVFRVRQGIPDGVSAEERAKVISDRLQQIANDSSVQMDTTLPPNQRSISYTTPSRTDSGVTIIGTNVKDETGTINNRLLVTVRNSDAKSFGVPREQVAEEIATRIDTAIDDYKLNQGRKQLALAIFCGLLLLPLLLLVILKGFLRLRNVAQPQWLNSNRWVKWGIIPFTLLGFLALSLVGFWIGSAVFPETFSANGIINQFQDLTASLLQYLPNLVILIVIAWLVFLAIVITKFIITELGNDAGSPWFDPEWSHPTVTLATLLILAVGCILALPYLPGFGSPTFLGVLVILGLLFVLSSYSIVANAIAGLVLIYSSKWSGLKDDREITLSNSMGQMTMPGRLRKSLFVSQLTFEDGKQIFVPNSMLLNSYVTLQPLPPPTPNPGADATAGQR
ncbi:MAG: hypothetical protein NW224_26655 [Leptolyngbyaceae cyanobacterium bins.302]|nr:hypothetical protein [Leptolyngbyaceae cyanobacterium bins.302]